MTTINRIFDGLARDLKANKVKVKKVKGWKNRGREGTWQPHGVLFHHTASNKLSGNAPALGTVTNGRTDLPGPLSNFVVGRNGTVFFVAKGRCNHAGEGGPIKGIPKDSGNAYLIGIECENNGIGEPWPSEQKRAIAILCSLLLIEMDEGARMLIAHKEWTSRKIDPHGIDMRQFRDRVRRWMKNAS